MKHTMKHPYMAILVVMGAILLGCETTEIPQPENNIVVCTTTVSFATDGTKALTEHGVKTFAEGEKIAVIYKNESNETLKAVSDPLPSGSYGNTASFTVALVNPSSGAAVRIIYPAAMAASTVATTTEVDDDATINYAALATQDGTLSTLSSTLDLAVYDGTLAGTVLPANPALKNKLAICKYTLKDDSGTNDITGTVSGLLVQNGTNSYYVSRTPDAGPIYVAIRPTASATIKYTARTSTVWQVKTVTDKTYEASEMYNLGLRMTALPEDTLPGQFTIADGKQVRFSKGNLQATYDASAQTWTWGFAAHQYDRIGNAPGNTTITTEVKEATEPYARLSGNGTVDLFDWSTAYTYYGISTSNDGTYTNNTSAVFVDWGGLSIGSSSPGDWYTPSWAKLEHMLFSRNASTIGSTENARFLKVSSVVGMKGIIIFPDDFTWDEGMMGTAPSCNNDGKNNGNGTFSADQWAAMEAAGAVFLPSTGYRKSSTYVDTSDSYYHYGCYWTNDVAKNSTGPGFLWFKYDNGTVGREYRYGDKSGVSVRLVRDL